MEEVDGKVLIMFRHLVCTGREVLGHDIEFGAFLGFEIRHF